MYFIVYENKKSSNKKFICSENEYMLKYQHLEVFSVEDTLEDANRCLNNWNDDILELNAEQYLLIN